ncbi:GNAT family N-acetyltransferase [Microbacterium paludicola]|uniref:GNAT family N-acetyltransferase n=1 Tax=Microbacterium paludicola TaxID=300019 RepID=A0A4Y9FVJ8_9MICO|nr:GNAT family N-acetyltransferase [Microbacterium paludicola]MBF0816345.1 GNAT family N-acetyltransferase [Microbacterium paludicola]TFU33008.1 GNAT family N-acetyltransferase [Microbacterium paludicola]
MAELPDARTLPLDETTRAALAERGLEYRLIENERAAIMDAWSHAVRRGFAGPELSDDEIAEWREPMSWRRVTGVYDLSTPQAERPVATASSWVAPMTVPGGVLPSWSISTITVAATHRRRGVARALLEAELRDAHAAGVPAAGLTASEATIYGRYGFAPATRIATWKVDTRRARWAGPDASGRVQYLDREDAARLMGDLHERTLPHRVGEIPGWPRRWRGRVALAEDKSAAVRTVRYVDAAGEPRGVMAYSVEGDPEDDGRGVLRIRYLIAEHDEALAALWRFAIEHDLVGTVVAPMRPVDEPLPWFVDDARVPVSRQKDHGWLRILDVPAALEARAYAAPASFTMRVTDPLGYADGIWRVDIADGKATVATADAAPDLELSVIELSAVYLGGFSLAVLRAAGRVSGSTETVDAVDAALRVPRAPFLSIVY